MKTGQFKATFKTVNANANSIHAGKKREDIQVSYLEIEADDVVSLNPDWVAAILNSNLIEFGKKLLAENGDDWDFKPDESQINFEAFYEDFSSPSKRGARILSKANLMEYGIEFEEYLKETLKKSEASANANRRVVEAKFQPLIGQPEAITIIASNLAEFQPSSDKLKEVHNALIILVSNLMESEPQDLSKLL